MIFRSLSTQPVRPVSHDPRIRKRVLLAGGEVSHLGQLAIAELPAGEATSAHRHPDMSEVFVVLEGEAELRVDGEQISLEAGDCLVVEPGEEHVLRNRSASEILRVVYFGTLS